MVLVGVQAGGAAGRGEVGAGRAVKMALAWWGAHGGERELADGVVDRGGGSLIVLALAGVTGGCGAQRGEFGRVDLVAGAVTLDLKRGVLPDLAGAAARITALTQRAGQMRGGMLQPPAGVAVSQRVKLMLGGLQPLARVGMPSVPVAHDLGVVGGGLAVLVLFVVEAVQPGMGVCELVGELAARRAAASDQPELIGPGLQITGQVLLLADPAAELVDSGGPGGVLASCSAG